MYEIEELGNNKYEINGEQIYAPNIETATRRYRERFEEERKETREIVPIVQASSSEEGFRS